MIEVRILLLLLLVDGMVSHGGSYHCSSTMMRMEYISSGSHEQQAVLAINLGWFSVSQFSIPLLVADFSACVVVFAYPPHLRDVKHYRSNLRSSITCCCVI